MKRSFFQCFLIALIMMSSLGTTRAASLVAGALEPTQILNNIELLAVNVSDALTAVSTDLVAVKRTILDPIGNVLIAIAQQKAATDILSWANGGFQGKNSLVISSPEKFINSKGLDTVKGLLGGIKPNSSYGDSILGTVISNVKYSDTNSQLASLSQSAVPSIVQKNVCDEATLNNTARYDVTDENGNVDQAAFTARKKELYARLCVGDPNKDPKLASTLTQVNKQNPSLGGWDAWLATTGGDNQYRTNTQSAIIIGKAQEEKKLATTNQLNQGGGVASETKCIKKNADGVTCADEQIVTPSGTVQKSLSGSVTAGLDRLNSLQGDGALSALLTGFATKFIMKGINNALSGVLSNSPNSSTGTNRTTKGPNIQDLTTDPDTKAAITGPMMKMFNSSTKSLTTLKSLDEAYLNSIDAYDAKVTAIKSCYDALVLADPSLEGTAKVVRATNFYNNRKEQIVNTQNDIRPELKLVGEALEFIINTSNSIRNSNSTQEISTIFNDYQNQVETRKYPGVYSEAQRRGEYARNKSAIADDMGPQGEMTSIAAAGNCSLDGVASTPVDATTNTSSKAGTSGQ